MINEGLLKEYELKEYNVINALSQNDYDMINSFIDYQGNISVADAISEISDSYIPIYNHELFENCGNLYECGAYEESFDQGLMGVSGNLIDNLKMAWYGYNSTQLSNNFEAMIYNYAIDYIKTNQQYLTQEELSEMETELKTIDSMDFISNIADIVINIIDNRENEV